MKVIIDPHTHLVVELRGGEVLYEHLPEEAKQMISKQAQRVKFDLEVEKKFYEWNKRK